MSDIPPIRVRPEDPTRPEELAAIRAIHDAAFGGPDEGVLVDGLRTGGHMLLCLVAESDATILGHIAFSRMWIKSAGSEIPAVALAPVAVLPGHQGCGIGAQLVRAGLDALRIHAERIVIVVGHPAYYPKFGFSTAKARQIESPFPPDAFMAMELSPGALNGVQGKVVYAAPFGIS